MPHRSSVPLYWRLRKAKHSLAGTKCDKCGSVFFPPRPLCSQCRSRGQIREFQFSGNGSILSWTVIRTAPEGFEKQVPYTIALIKLDEGTVISGQIVGGSDGIKIGNRVKSVFRKMYSDGSEGLLHYGLKFELVR